MDLFSSTPKLIFKFTDPSLRGEVNWNMNSGVSTAYIAILSRLGCQYSALAPNQAFIAKLYSWWFGGSPNGCVLVEKKAQHRGKWQQQQHRTSLDQLLVQHKCTVMDEMNGNCEQLPFSTLRGFPLYEANQIARAAVGQPTFLEQRRFGEWYYNCHCRFGSMKYIECSALLVHAQFTFSAEMPRQA